MKKILLLFILILSIKIYSQRKKNTCFDYMNLPQNKEFCDTTFLTNGSKLYYQWNCDSTWLTFENKEKIILKSCTDLDPIVCSRLGLTFIEEYPNYLFFVHQWISGCCQNPDLVFINKTNGKEIKRIESELFIWGDSNENYSLYFSDSSFTKLVYLNHLSDTEYYFQFEENQVLNSAKEIGNSKASNVFKNFIKEDEKEVFKFDFINAHDETEQLNIQIK